jgi:hypothetical protein
MSQNVFSIRPFEAKRVRVESTRPFDEVLLNLRQLVGMAPLQAETTSRAERSAKAPAETFEESYHAVKQGSESFTRERLEHLVQSQVGASDFMLFLEIDHGTWLPAFGIRRKVVRWILGNPLIAITMMRHDLTAGLFAPVEFLLLENASGQGSTLIYDLPSSLMVIEPNPALKDAAQVLDRKLETLVRRVMGVELDRTPEQMDHHN